MAMSIETLASRLEEASIKERPAVLSEFLASRNPNFMTADSEELASELARLFGKYHLESIYMEWVMKQVAIHGLEPLETLPCANVRPAEDWRCPNRGTLGCSQCRLVSYCSKECQKANWVTHKRDCKDPIRSFNWQPDWVKYNRTPSFMQTGPPDEHWLAQSVRQRDFALGIDLWGNIPAYDILNLTKNEGGSESRPSGHTNSLNVAYVASGDLRNVIRTVNGLPDNFDGSLTIMLNDRHPMLVLRNVLLLLILGTGGDQIAPNAELALHFWYSSFYHSSHDAQITCVMMQLACAFDKDGRVQLPLGGKSAISGLLSEEARMLLAVYSKYDLSLQDASKETNRVRFEPSRVDRHHRKYARLEPSHRLASLEFRRFGLVLPFGAANNQFSTPNKFLFSPDGRWWQDDLADPLDSWSVEEVIMAGKRYGAQREDLYGCLYFYLSEQLRLFSQRLRQHSIKFCIFDCDAQDLAKSLQQGKLEPYGLPSSTSFDRIDVSNILDTEYLGLSKVLSDWGPRLRNGNKCATLLGYSMNWVPKQPDAQPNSEGAIRRITDELIDKGRIKRSAHPMTILAYQKYFTPLYDNSKAFQSYLQGQGIKEAMEHGEVKLKNKHTIVPHRIGVPLEGSPSALPIYPTDESWYLKVQVSGSLLSERFLEFQRK